MWRLISNPKTGPCTWIPACAGMHGVKSAFERRLDRALL